MLCFKIGVNPDENDNDVPVWLIDFTGSFHPLDIAIVVLGYPNFGVWPDSRVLRGSASAYVGITLLL